MKSRNFAFTLATASAPPTANIEFAVTHDLNATPSEAFITRRFSNAHIYRGTTAWTKTTAYFKSTGSNAAFVVALLV